MATYLVLTASPVIQQLQADINNDATTTTTLIIQSEEGKAIGIDQAREVTRFCHKKALEGHKKLIVILQANKLTEEAQNALLKTLEEHPDYIDIVLTAKNEHGILPTVLSRCKKLAIETQSQKTPTKANKSTLVLASSMTLSEKLEYAQKLAKKDKTAIFAELEDLARLEEQAGCYAQAQCLLDCAQVLEQLNLNTRLALEACLIKLNQDQ